LADTRLFGFIGLHIVCRTGTHVLFLVTLRMLYCFTLIGCCTFVT